MSLRYSGTQGNASIVIASPASWLSNYQAHMKFGKMRASTNVAVFSIYQ